MKIAMYAGFPPPLTGQTLANKVFLDYLDKKKHVINKYDTAVDFQQIGKFNFKKITNGLGLAWEFYKKSDDIDLVYTAMSQSQKGFLKFLPMFKICQKKQIPYVIHLHGNLLPKTYKNSGYLIKKLILNVLNKSKRVIVLSEKLQKQNLYQLLSTKVSIVKNFVESDYFVSYQEKLKVMNQLPPLKLFYLSNLMETKGILDVLKAALILKEKGLDFKLKIAGSWENKIKQEGKKLIKNLGEEHVKYLGFVTGEEKRSLILESHVFLLPTYYPQEGQPISILEAMAGGNVILTTQHSGIPDIVKENKNGFFVERKNPKSIASQLEQIYYNKSILKNIAKNNIKEAQKKYTVERFCKEVEDIMLKAVGRKV